MPLLPPPPAGQVQRQVLLNLKCLFWCVHQLGQQYNLNLVHHSLERGYLHPELANSHIGDNIQFLMDNLGEDELAAVCDALASMRGSRDSIDVDDKHFEIGHYIQAITSFGPIAEESYGIITSITPEMRGIFYLDGHLMECEFAPSEVRVIFGTYIS
jgi:hypothetical protein